MNENMITNLVIESLIKDYGYSKNQISSEVRVRDRNADIIVYDSSKKSKAFIVIEVKSNQLMQSMIVQLEPYLRSSKAKFGLMTNGKDKFAVKIGKDGNYYPIIDIPRKNEQIIEFPNKTQLSKSKDISYALWRISDYLRADFKLHDLSNEILKILLCKIVDEKNSSTSQFWVTTREMDNANEKDSFKDRLNSLLINASKEYSSIIQEPISFQINQKLLKKCISEIQIYSILGTESSSSIINFIEKQDIFSKRGYNIQIPETLIKLILDLLNPLESESFLDPTCMTGNLLTGVLNHLFPSKKSNRKLNYSYSNLFGSESSTRSSSIAKMSMVLQGNGSSNIFNEESIRQESSIDIKAKKIGGFDIITSIPPFGKRIVDNKLITNSRLAKEKKNINYIDLLIEKSLDWLKDNGRLAIVVDEGLLFSESSVNTRRFIQENYIIKGIISLPHKLFYPFLGIKTNLLLLERPSKFPITNYPIFMASMEKEDIELSIEQIKIISDAFKSFKKNESFKVKEVYTLNLSELKNDNWSVNRHSPYLKQKRDDGIPLENVCKIIPGKKVSSKDYLENSSDGIPYLRISDMVDGEINKTTLKYVHPKIFNEKNKLHPGDILLSVTGTIGKVAIITKSYINSIPSLQITVLRPNPKKVESEYLLQILTTPHLNSVLNNLKKGVYINHLSISDIKQVRVVIPTLDKQKKYLKEIKKLKETKKSYNKKLQEIQNSIDHLSEVILNGE